MKIRCRQLGANKSISINREYEVIDESDNRYAILNDKGIQKNYAKSLFDVIPEIPPVQIIDELNIETSFLRAPNGSTLLFKVTCPFIGRNRFEFTSGNILSLFGASISCGIMQIEGVNSFISSLKQMKVQFDAYMRNHTNVFVLNEEIDLDEVFKDIYVSLMQDLLALFQEANNGSAMLLLSTTSHSINSLPDLKDVFEELAVTTTVAHNPNSGNEIILWNFLTGNDNGRNEEGIDMDFEEQEQEQDEEVLERVQE